MRGRASARARHVCALHVVTCACAFLVRWDYGALGGCGRERLPQEGGSEIHEFPGPNSRWEICLA